MNRRRFLQALSAISANSPFAGKAILVTPPTTDTRLEVAPMSWTGFRFS